MNGKRSGTSSLLGTVILIGLAVWFVTDYEGFSAVAATVVERGIDFVTMIGDMIEQRSSL
jgi:hypothetical protein